MKTCALIAALVGGAVLAAHGDAADFYDRTTDGQKIAWMARGMEMVKQKLKDPGSAQFRNVLFSQSGGVPMTCGEVNSKNSFGGYAGFQRFVSAGKMELTFLESEVSDFKSLWNRMCQ